MLFLTYLLMGAFMFYSIEYDIEEEKRETAKRERKEINGKNDNNNRSTNDC